MQSLKKSGGGLVAFFDRPIAGTLGVVTLALWGAMTLLWMRRRWHAGAQA